MPDTRNIIVMGASAGGFEAFRRIVAALPADFSASIFIVWHMAPHIRSVLPHVLNRVNSIYTAHAYDNEEILPNRIYIAPPDHHLLIEEGKVRITRGPKENRFRPAVDPLFRSAAYTYGNRVVGVILSGALDDGTSGLWTIKDHGGIAVVQNPMDAEVPSMPEHAIREVAIDHIVPVAEMAGLLVKLAAEEVEESRVQPQSHHDLTNIEIHIAEEDAAMETGIMQFGDLTPFTCPECHGVLTRIMDGKRARYRCHTGHAFSADALLSSLTENIEDSLWNAIRGMDENIMLLNHIGDHFAEINQPQLAATYFNKAQEAEARSQLVRKAVFSHEQYSKDSIEHSEDEGDNEEGNDADNQKGERL
jgi:two-component system chemotaxis response regulator CheB